MSTLSEASTLCTLSNANDLIGLETHHSEPNLVIITRRNRNITVLDVSKMIEKLAEHLRVP